MLALSLGGAWLRSQRPGIAGTGAESSAACSHKTSILFMIAAALDMVASYAAVAARGRAAVRHPLHSRLRAPGRALGARADPRRDQPQGRRGPGGNRLGNAIGIIRLLVSVAIFAIAIIVILDNLGVNVTGLVAGLGIGGIAIGLAAQGIFSDLFAALSILFDKPFKRGDVIQFDQIDRHGRADRAQDHAPALRSTARRW